jgi:hypothetical protein
MSEHEIKEENNNENNGTQRHSRIKSEVSINSNINLLNPTITNHNIDEPKLEEKQKIEKELVKNIKINHGLIKSKKKNLK